MAADRRYRVLVVDDEDSIRTLVDRVLRDAGYETTIAPDAAAALAIAASVDPFDLLLTDMMMPAMCGDELARHLRLRHPDLRVLYLTGFADRLFATRPVLWSNEAFIEKPITVTGLREAVSLAIFGHTQGPQGAPQP
jgi:two-component system, cell cycle sensor histidine kinase and response regulator CckA